MGKYILKRIVVFPESDQIWFLQADYTDILEKMCILKRAGQRSLETDILWCFRKVLIVETEHNLVFSNQINNRFTVSQIYSW